jgi:hypothetical protein
MNGIGKDIYERLTIMGVRMVLDGTPVKMAVAVLTQTSWLSPAQAAKVEKLIRKEIRK